MCRKIVSQRLSKRDCIFPLAREDIFGVRFLFVGFSILRNLRNEGVLISHIEVVVY